MSAGRSMNQCIYQPERAVGGRWYAVINPNEEHDLQLVEENLNEIKPPLMYKVILINDDYTPMEFVINTLIRFFHHNEEKAIQIMLDVHTQGKGICGVYTCDVAETKAMAVNSFARQNKHPLLCKVEPS